MMQLGNDSVRGSPARTLHGRVYNNLKFGVSRNVTNKICLDNPSMTSFTTVRHIHCSAGKIPFTRPFATMSATSPPAAGNAV